MPEGLGFLTALWDREGQALRGTGSAAEADLTSPRPRPIRGALKDPMVHARESWPRAGTCVYSWSREDRAP